MADELAVWMYGTHIATVEPARGRPRLTYTDGALERFPLGTPLLSLSLPVTDRRYPQGVVRAFLNGLLPEGEARRTIAREVGVAASDTVGLIGALGRDCAGALVIQPIDEPAPPAATTTTAEPLTLDELATIVRALRNAPLGAGGRVRISLAGVQEKLLLTKMPDGQWGRPVDGTPSTHILKPEIAAYPDTVANEAFGMRVAAHLGLAVANVDTTEVAGRKLLVVERYDREVATDGRVERIHQEDFCQATGTPPETKYEEDGGPSLARIAGIVATVAAPDSLERLLAAVTVNCILGNGDAHAKNFSLLHDASGALRLSPVYDLMCTLHYGDNRLAMYVDNVRRTDRVTAERIVNEAVRWGVDRRRASDLVLDLVERTPAAMDAALDETAGVPPQLVETVTKQLAQLRSDD